MSCQTGKQQFRDELDAMIALTSRKSREKGEVRCYRCPFCPGWHLTSQPKRRSIMSDDHE